MSEERFLESLGEQAGEEIVRIRRDAERQAKRIIDEAEAEACRDAEERLRLAEAEAEARRARVLNAASRRGRRFLLEAVHTLAAEGVEELKSLVRGLAGPRRARVLEGLLDECDLPEGATVVCLPGDREVLESAVRRRGLALSFSDGALPLGGLIVLSADERFVQRNTFEGRIEKAMGEIVKAVVRSLPEGVADGEGLDAR